MGRNWTKLLLKKKRTWRLMERLQELINSKMVLSRCTWKVIVGVLRDTGEADKADKVYSHHIEPFE